MAGGGEVGNGSVRSAVWTASVTAPALVLALVLVFVSGVVVAAPFANLDPSGVLAGASKAVSGTFFREGSPLFRPSLNCPAVGVTKSLDRCCRSDAGVLGRSYQFSFAAGGGGGGGSAATTACTLTVPKLDCTSGSAPKPKSFFGALGVFRSIPLRSMLRSGDVPGDRARRRSRTSAHPTMGSGSTCDCVSSARMTSSRLDRSKSRLDRLKSA